MQTIRPADAPKFVILGASGRLGQLIRPFWPISNTIWHSHSQLEGYKSLDLLRPSDNFVEILHGATAVICLAGVTPHSKNGSLGQNLLLAETCLNAAKSAKIGRVFLTSTAAVYGKQTGRLDENCPTSPLSDYARAKVEMEDMALQHSQTSTILRIGNVAGADAILGNWHPKMKIEQLPNNATPKRSYIGPATLARIFLELASHDELPSILNVAAPRSVHMNKLLDSAGLDYTMTPATSQTIADVTLDTKRLQRYVTFTEEHSLPSSMVAEWKKAVSAG
jgi:UDP-glucose 4-epimerase